MLDEKEKKRLHGRMTDINGPQLSSLSPVELTVLPEILGAQRLKLLIIEHGYPLKIILPSFQAWSAWHDIFCSTVSSYKNRPYFTIGGLDTSITWAGPIKPRVETLDLSGEEADCPF